MRQALRGPERVIIMSNTTVRIYTVTCTRAYMMSEQGTRFSLQPWGANTVDYAGYDDGGIVYALPDGYTVAECNGRTLEIYDPQGERDQIVDDHGHPAVVAGVGYAKGGKIFARYLRLRPYNAE